MSGLELRAEPVATACALATLLALAAAARPRAAALALAAQRMGEACGLLALLAFASRWRAVGHLPLFGTYESALSLSVAVLAAGALVRRAGAPVGAWAAACGLAAALLGHGASFDATPLPLTISERSWVVEVHAVLAWGAFGGLGAAAGLGAVLAWPRTSARARAACARVLTPALSTGFLLHTAMIATGSLYEFMLFGRAWSFDPVETLGLAAWVSYGTLLHLQLLGGWEGRRLGAWSLALFVLLTVSYRGIVYFPAWSSYHIFDMNLRLHLTPQEGGSPGGGP